ncbi:MAG TPA: BON domain-containing protein [Rhodocyclaceae bacterium]|nr:BON domain-containing protein [Rhodocyclaceae bacterium]
MRNLKTHLKTFMLVAVSAAVSALSSNIWAQNAMSPTTDSDSNGSTSRSAGQFVDDSAITTTVKAKLIADKTTKARDIKVETRNGVVQLSGAVDSSAESQRAQSIAQSVKGVQSVDNQLTMKP